MADMADVQQVIELLVAFAESVKPGEEFGIRL